MRKNNLINLMVGAAMLLTMSFGLSSCEDILGEWDKPAPIHVNIDGSNEVTITKTETGATVTVNTPSDITNFISQVKDDITAKGTEEYVFDITNSGVKSTSGDNTIIVPKVDGSNINLLFEKGINTESPLIIKASETASATPTTAVNKLTITMPAGTTGLNLVIDMPETSVTVKTVAGTVIYEGIVANTAINTLILESGVTVKTLLWKGGNITMNSGATIETLAAETNEGGIFEAWSSGADIYSAEADRWYSIYYYGSRIKNFKVLKGSSESMNVYFSLWDNGSTYGKLTIADGVAIMANNLSIQEIEGEGTAKITLMSNSIGETWEGDNHYYTLNPYLNSTIIKGIIFTEPINTNNEVIVSKTSLQNVPTNIEDCTFNYDEVWFANSNTTSGSAKNCEFLSSNNNKRVNIQVPVQTAEISSYKFAFSNCNFSEGTMIYSNLQQQEYEYDSNGNPVFYKTPWYAYEIQEGNTWRQYVVEDESEVPENAQFKYTGDWQRQKFSYVEFNNYNVTIAFDGCKLGNASINNESGCFGSPYVPSGVVFKYEIDGTSYSEWEWTSDETTQKSYIILK